MSDDKPQKTDRYRDTVFLPRTSFAMKAGLPQKEPELLKRWEAMDLYGTLRRQSAGRPKYVLHDGPPYANGHLHIGHALNKILKDIVTRSRQMQGYDSNYVPGWDCHGLPIEWKIEEQYREKGKNKDEVPINDFRKECRAFAEHWINVQREEFKRLGVTGDWDNPYLTMNFRAEALIAKELLKFAASGQLYRGSKPVMWSVVEKTALAEAEVEYQDYQSDTIWVKFPVRQGPQNLLGISVVIWTTTPWTIPGNRAVSFSSRIGYGLYEVTAAPEGNWAKAGDKLILADRLAEEVMKAAKVESFTRHGDVDPTGLILGHPLAHLGYSFGVPMLDGGHVTDDTGTGFVHTAPGHGADDYNIWAASEAYLKDKGISATIPFTVDADGFYTKDAPGFTGKRVITGTGEKGDANDAVIRALTEAGALISRGRLRHQYPHSWRSRKPVIFRNTPQWFISMSSHGLRDVALKAIDETKFYPPGGQNRLRAMIEQRPDWVISRQRAWGVPIAVFVNRGTGEILNDPKVNQRIVDAFSQEGADAWFAEGAAQRFLGPDYSILEWEQVRDILDVWFDSGSTHAFVLEQRPDLKWPADIYLEGSDQHRGWFHSSLLEACGTRGRAPYDAVLTHGFVVAEDGRKMSKSLGNIVAPQDVIRQSGADILRLWVASADYAEDLRLGPEILKTNIEAYRKLRNTMRYILGAVDGLQDWEFVPAKDMPELERYILHRLHELEGQVRQAYALFDYKRLFALLTNFMTADLSAFYFDIRKDSLYCDAWSSLRRRSCRTVMDQLFHCLTTWWAPVLAFTMDEVWLSRFPAEGSSVHLMQFARCPDEWAALELAAKWDKIREVRSVVTGALEIERQIKKTIGSALEAAPEVYVSNPGLLAALDGVDLAEISITSAAKLISGEGPEDGFRLDTVKGVAVVFRPAEGRRCARSWKISPGVGSDPQFPDITPRDADAVREWQARFEKTV
ncbi:MAG: isoleucine--tRNA ligase [Aestuariivirga sp.]|uniref:isoleucine--tRNA ligase n=1 Tax=Aestuariivirga sp. TaxID=2650926 RepID=UPI0025B8262B|nr:isoleucine--tRNA ligase [Aestuariivirga sp.]MCA3559690.1 isoleucine--tRNA ligase [Aestuariivirga sp.]